MKDDDFKHGSYNRITGGFDEVNGNWIWKEGV